MRARASLPVLIFYRSFNQKALDAGAKEMKQRADGCFIKKGSSFRRKLWKPGFILYKGLFTFSLL
jgi:hypothetical protein